MERKRAQISFWFSLLEREDRLLSVEKNRRKTKIRTRQLFSVTDRLRGRVAQLHAINMFLGLWNYTCRATGPEGVYLNIDTFYKLFN